MIPHRTTSKPICFSRGHNKFDNKPEQRQCTNFAEFEHAVLSDMSEAKGQTYICSPLQSGIHYQKPDKYPGEATWRLKDHVGPRQFIAFDFDGFSSTDAFQVTKEYLRQYRGFGYTTASHTDEKPRARVILLASRSMTREECETVSVVLEDEIALSVMPEKIKFDASVYRGEQPIYTPVVGAETFILDGGAIDVDAYLKIELNRQSTVQLAELGTTYVEPSTVPSGERNPELLSYIGHLRATGEYEDVVVTKAHEFNATKCQPSLDDTEVADLLARYPDQQNMRPSAMASEEWPEPDEIKAALKPVPEFDLDMLPEVFKPYVSDVSELMDTPADLIAIP